jgi:hypothetical protein
MLVNGILKDRRRGERRSPSGSWGGGVIQMDMPFVGVYDLATDNNRYCSRN